MGALFAVIGLLTGCESVTKATLNEVVSSIPYDRYSCRELTALRDQEASRFGLPRDAEIDQRWAEWIRNHPPLGSILPDMRSRTAREAGKARGRIAAMNHSLRRQGCESAA
ncbi:hypothetical protein [Chelativorans sp. M5D2P16]|uniref:hypothetical protein n=1 Tax=Chelativorans sp. M5D2P16 TaxID=3095678 RepID=UPI002ACA2F06|nr:hypothetical protein [Chelativorans sp. M5D2P16]MDZ5699963.1 hypothetical protein [Chelativorans sp. M5D2P16]